MSIVLSNFRNLNKQLKRKPYSIHKINEILLELEVFHYPMSLNLSMGYYHIWIRKNTSNLCTIILPRGKYHYKCLTTVPVNSPDILQQNTKYLYHGFEFIHAYIDDPFIYKNILDISCIAVVINPKNTEGKRN